MKQHNNVKADLENCSCLTCWECGSKVNTIGKQQTCKEQVKHPITFRVVGKEGNLIQYECLRRKF